MLKGFKDFIMRGNVIDLAVAVVVGTAFAAVVAAFSKGLIEPLIGIFLGGGVNAGQVTINGQVIDFTLMINAIITFLITMVVIYFAFILPMNKWRQRMGKQHPDVAPADIQLLEEIRDLLKEQRSS
jgi:large conductance mechanosensitive channel